MRTAVARRPRYAFRVFCSAVSLVAVLLAVLFVSAGDRLAPSAGVVEAATTHSLSRPAGARVRGEGPLAVPIAAPVAAPHAAAPPPAAAARLARGRELAAITDATFSLDHPFTQAAGPPPLAFLATPRAPDARSACERASAFFDSVAKDALLACAGGVLCGEHLHTARYLFTAHGIGATGVRGTYIEAGALDGLSGSLSLFFDAALHWRGVLIEGNPPNFARALHNRPHAARVEMALCDADDTQVLFVGDYGGVARGRAAMSEGFRVAFHGQRADGYNVSCGTLARFLPRALRAADGVDDADADAADDARAAGGGGGVRGPASGNAAAVPPPLHIDVLFLDVEGAELAALRGMDWARTSVDYVLVELNPAFDVSQLDAVRALLRGVGFGLVAQVGEMNELFRHARVPPYDAGGGGCDLGAPPPSFRVSPAVGDA